MSLKPKPIIITVAILIPLCIIFTVSYFVLKTFYSDVNQLKSKSKYIPVKRVADGSAEEQKFNEIMIDFYSMSSMAEGIFPVDTTLAGREKSLSDIKDIGIYYWNRNLEILDSAKKITNSKDLHTKIAAYKAYCELNKKCYELMYKAVDSRSRKHDEQIDQYFAEIAKKSEELRQE
jgi:hypothetical protein